MCDTCQDCALYGRAGVHDEHLTRSRHVRAQVPRSLVQPHVAGARDGHIHRPGGGNIRIAAAGLQHAVVQSGVMPERTDRAFQPPGKVSA